jgi:SRSO17 transposase
LEDRDLAARGKTKSSFALRCRTRSARASRLLAKRAASGRVAVDGVAPRGGRTNQILLSTLPADTTLSNLVRLAKQRWIIERDYQELKQELGLGHFEGRGWRGFHHHATLCIAAYGFLVAERSRFSPSARASKLQLCAPKLPIHFKPRGSPSPGRAA